MCQSSATRVIMPIYQMTRNVRILDRYVIRQVLMPFGIGLLVFTFIFIIPVLIEVRRGLHRQRRADAGRRCR